MESPQAITQALIPNFAIVDPPLDGLPGVYRGAQPVYREDFEYLKGLGVVQIIKLNYKSEGSDDIWTEMGGELFCIPEGLTEQILTEPSIPDILSGVAFVRPGTFIHCGSTARTLDAIQSGDPSTAGGQDRTGLFCGAYRLTQGWTKARAYAEMLAHGFHAALFGLEKAWADLKEGGA